MRLGDIGSFFLKKNSLCLLNEILELKLKIEKWVLNLKIDANLLPMLWLLSFLDVVIAQSTWILLADVVTGELKCR